MPTVNLQHYASKPLTMDFGVTITSPVPNGRDLKTMKALTEYSAVTAVVAESAQRNGDSPQEAVREIPVPDALTENMNVDVAVLTLGEEEVARLRSEDCPEPLIDKAAMYALLYWSTGEDTAAGNAWLEQVEATRNPKAPRAPRRRDTKGKQRRSR